MAGRRHLRPRVDARHTREGYAFQQRAATAGFRQAVTERDAEPFGDRGASTLKG